MAAGLTITVVAEDDDGVEAVGTHQPVGGVTEIVGVATLPSARRRGLGAAVTAALVTTRAAAAPTSCSCRRAATTSRASTGGSGSNVSARRVSPSRSCQAEPVTRALERPGAVAVAGALTIAFSAILVKLADVEPATAAIFRCAYALPLLGALALVRGPALRPPPAAGAQAGDPRRHLLRRRPDLLAPRDRRRRRRARDRARQPAGGRRAVRGLGCCSASGSRRGCWRRSRSCAAAWC